MDLFDGEHTPEGFSIESTSFKKTQAAGPTQPINL
jgi:hypothetical protein